MCRIVGFWDLKHAKSYEIEKVISLMKDAMIYGGPDDSGVYIDYQNGLALGHRRLSILDLSPKGHQPMEFENFVIIYNGEIYNFREIKKELELYGYKFDSSSDTEVILKAFHKWEFNAVHKFRGMFAFAIWDKKEKKLILCRDRVGVKPLFWYWKDGFFMFSSELKAFHKHPKFNKTLNFKALALFFQYGFIPSPYSIFEHVYKLEPGHFLIVYSSGNIEKIKYWEIEDHFLKGIRERKAWLSRREEDIIEELESLLTESFKLRLVSDVPVGIFLSGGIDSTIVSTLLAKEGVNLKTFTIGFYEEEYNEAHYAKKIATYLGTEHTELYCTLKETFEIIPKLSEIYDEPFGDPSAIPTYFVSKLAREKVKVALSADGGDEQFCGYTRYWVTININKLSKAPLFKKSFLFILKLLNPDIAFNLYNFFKFILPKTTNFRDKYVKLLNILQENDLLHQYDLSLKIFLEKDLFDLGIDSYKQEFLDLKRSILDPYSLLMLYDFKTYLPDNILVKVDRATMSVSLEGREPFLDHKIIEWTCKLPSEFKYKKRKNKYLLRKILYKYIPYNLVERPKQGFGIPMYEWFKSELKQLYLEYLDEEKIIREGIFNPQQIKKLVDDFIHHKKLNHNKLWLLLVFRMWAEKWL